MKVIFWIDESQYDIYEGGLCLIPQKSDVVIWNDKKHIVTNTVFDLDESTATVKLKEL